MEMTAKALDGKTLEHKAWGRVFNDGLWDLYLGVLFLNVVVWMAGGELGWAYSDTAIPALIVLFLAGSLFRIAKKRITAPRMGEFKIARDRTSRFRLGLALSVAVTVALVVFTILSVTGAFPDGIPTTAIIFGVLALQGTLMFSLAAYFLGVQRFYVYALFFAVGMLGGEITVAYMDIARGWDVVAMFGLPALVMIPVGLALLLRFVRAYPVGGRSDDVA